MSCDGKVNRKICSSERSLNSRLRVIGRLSDKINCEQCLSFIHFKCMRNYSYNLTFYKLGLTEL